MTPKKIGRRRRPEKNLGSNGENKKIRFGNDSAPQAREKYRPKMDDERDDSSLNLQEMFRKKLIHIFVNKSLKTLTN